MADIEPCFYSDQEINIFKKLLFEETFHVKLDKVNKDNAHVKLYRLDGSNLSQLFKNEKYAVSNGFALHFFFFKSLLI